MSLHDPNTRIILKGDKDKAKSALPMALKLQKNDNNIEKDHGSNLEVTNKTHVVGDTRIDITTVHGQSTMTVYSPPSEEKEKKLKPVTTKREDVIKVPGKKKSDKKKYIKLIVHVDRMLDPDDNYDSNNNDHHLQDIQSAVGIGIYNPYTDELMAVATFDIAYSLSAVRSDSIWNNTDISNYIEWLYYYHNSYKLGVANDLDSSYDENKKSYKITMPPTTGTGLSTKWDTGYWPVGGTRLTAAHHNTFEPESYSAVSVCETYLQSHHQDGGGNDIPLCNYVYHELQCTGGTFPKDWFFFSDLGKFENINDSNVFCPSISSHYHETNTNDDIKVATFFSLLGEVYNGQIMWEDSSNRYQFDPFVVGTTGSGGLDLCHEYYMYPKIWKMDGINMFADGFLSVFVELDKAAYTPYRFLASLTCFTCFTSVNENLDVTDQTETAGITSAFATVFAAAVRHTGGEADILNDPGDPGSSTLISVPSEVADNQITYWGGLTGVDVRDKLGAVWTSPLLIADFGALMIEEVLEHKSDEREMAPVEHTDTKWESE